MRLRIWAWIETSSAETGSSAMTIFGRTASARAKPIRWRWPPENSCGYRLIDSAGSPTSSSSASTALVRDALLPSPWISRGSAMMSPTRLRGLSEA